MLETTRDLQGFVAVQDLQDRQYTSFVGFDIQDGSIPFFGGFGGL